MIGGGGEKKTLLLVARYADACNLFASPAADGPAHVAAKLDVLRDHCAREGSDVDAIRTTILWTGPLAPGADSAARFAEHMAAYAAVGVSEVHVMPMQGDPVAYVRNLGEHVIPRIRDL
jgi:alkanesulfonate monooxygenase SsuD/methylene tetrahydromethanopterin reductase-like flavin-dependent oxidoreductase (luciferase family)